MSEEQVVARNSKVKVLVGGSLAALLAIGIVGFIIYSATCPCVRIMNPFLIGHSQTRCRCASCRFMLGSGRTRLT